MIDERKSTTPKNKPAKVGQNPHRGPIKIRLSVGGRSELQLAETTEVAANCDVETGDEEAANKASGGIAELLRASNVAGPQAMEDLDEREAIVGMLTMSRGFTSPNSSSGDQSVPPSCPSSSQRHRKGRRRPNASVGDDYSDVVSKVHQDDEYSKTTQSIQ